MPWECSIVYSGAERQGHFMSHCSQTPAKSNQVLYPTIPLSLSPNPFPLLSHPSIALLHSILYLPCHLSHRAFHRFTRVCTHQSLSEHSKPQALQLLKLPHSPSTTQSPYSPIQRHNSPRSPSNHQLHFHHLVRMPNDLVQYIHHSPCYTTGGIQG